MITITVALTRRTSPSSPTNSSNRSGASRVRNRCGRGNAHVISRLRNRAHGCQRVRHTYGYHLTLHFFEVPLPPRTKLLDFFLCEHFSK